MVLVRGCVSGFFRKLGGTAEGKDVWAIIVELSTSPN